MLNSMSESWSSSSRGGCISPSHVGGPSLDRPLRSAFTLVELLVVILIIGILAAGTTTVVVKVIESQRRSSSKLLVDTIDRALSTQTSKLVDQARHLVTSDTSGNSDADTEIQIANSWNSVFVNTASSAVTIPSYLAQLKGFGLTVPVSFSGLELPNGTKVDGGGKNDPTSAEFESSVCLFMVMRGRFSALDLETLGRNAVQYAGPNKIPFIVDQWGDPIGLIIGQPGSKTSSPPVQTIVPRAFCKNL